MAKVGKQQFAQSLAKRLSLSNAQAEKTVNAMLEEIMDTLKTGDSITFTGFGTFEVRDRKAREGRNPKTGDKIKIKASRVPAFSAGKGLKDAVAK